MNNVAEKKVLNGTVGDIAFTGVFDHDSWTNHADGYNPNMHGWYEINLVWDGEYYLEGLNGDTVGPLCRGDVALISPGYFHQERKENRTQSSLYKVRFEVSRSNAPTNEEKLYDIFYRELQRLGHGIFSFRIPNGLRYMEEVFSCLGEGGTGRVSNAEATFKMFMTEFFIEIMHLKQEKNMDKADVIAVRKQIIETFMEQNYGDSKICAEHLAKHLNLSIRQMNRIVTEFYGVTFYQLLTSIRLEHSKALLLSGSMTVKEIATRVGYDSATGFFVAFKKKFGMTPGDFCDAAKRK